jgi:hypothetical protein
MIEVDGLTKRYGDKVAVDGLSFVVEPGGGDGVPGPERGGEVDHDAGDRRAGPAGQRDGAGQRQALPRGDRANGRARHSAGRAVGAPGPVGPQ